MKHTLTVKEVTTEYVIDDGSRVMSFLVEVRRPAEEGGEEFVQEKRLGFPMDSTMEQVEQALADHVAMLDGEVALAESRKTTEEENKNADTLAGSLINKSF